jgi:hypothetical protein
VLNGSHEAEGGTQLSALLLEGHSNLVGKANRGVRSPLKSAIAITQAEKLSFFSVACLVLIRKGYPVRFPRIASLSETSLHPFLKRVV